MGFSLVFVALSTAALSTIPRPSMTAAAGLYNVVRQVMGSVGIAIAATTLSTSTVRYRAILSEDAGASIVTGQWIDPVTAWMVSQGSDFSTARTQALLVLDKVIRRQAAVIAYNHVFALASVLFVVGFPLALLLRRGRQDVEVDVISSSDHDSFPLASEMFGPAE